jgi:hypothetical protein
MPEVRKEYGQTVGPLGFPMRAKAARALDHLLDALPKSKEYDYRKAIVPRAPTELNPGERSDVSWVSTESVDRQGEVVLARGMNNSQFLHNPLVTLGHAYHLPPIGRSLWQKRVTDGALVGVKAKTRYPQRPESWPAGEPWVPDLAFALVQNGLLSGKSIGFLPVKVHFADAKEAEREGWPEGTLVFDEWLLLEYACVYLPANQDALVEQVSKGALPPEWLEALGAPGLPPDPAKELTRQARTVPFTALSEVERAVEARLGKIDFRALAQERVKEVCDIRRGRV